MAKLKTPNDGAAATRAAVINHIVTTKTWPKSAGDAISRQDALKFVHGMAKRASARPGGLGRKKRAK